MSEASDAEFVSSILRRRPDQWQPLPDNGHWYYTVLKGEMAAQWQELEKSGFLELYGKKHGITLHTKRQYDTDREIESEPLKAGHPVGNDIAVLLSDKDFFHIRELNERQEQSKLRVGELIGKLALLKWRTIEKEGRFTHIADISSHPLREEFYELQSHMPREMPLASLSINRRVLRGGRKVTEVRINEVDFITLRSIASSLNLEGAFTPLFAPALPEASALPEEKSYMRLSEDERRKMAERIWNEAAHAGDLLVALRVLLGESREEFCSRSGVKRDRLVFLEQYGADGGLAPLAVKNALVKAIRHVGEKQPEWFDQERRNQFLLQWNPERNIDEIMRVYGLDEPIVVKPSQVIPQETIRAEVKQRYQLLKDEITYGDVQLRHDLNESGAGKNWSLNQIRDILQGNGKITLSFLDAFDKVFSDKTHSLRLTKGQRRRGTLVGLFGNHVENDMVPPTPGRPRGA